ncbi:MAG: tRNA uridine-5-carboxymethylaminomethyl(34) synthesis GTPase MnmE [Lachnospiraceae bacterium]|nr:tRNA uridine-5-carboxymethylaminomethyl(34) synthesis GTPase MnmE [Lachnospiraceae bacterium]
METDTIAAIATSLSESAIGIVRISGHDAIKIADRIVVNAKKEHFILNMESHTIRYGFLFNGEEILDEILVSCFRAPKSYTAEDTVEINTHGGVFVVKKALELCIKAGARLAEPGEFTKRAFLNGRIDLSEAEAVMDVISSSSEQALRSSVSVLRGKLYREILSLRDAILHETAFIEAALDDPEHYDLTGYSEKLSETIMDISKRIRKMIDQYEDGRILKEGINTVILGKPNAGKSSVMNLLAGYEKAIVTDIPGTTRDVIEASVQLGDAILRILDTAGIRETDDRIEKIGIEKALSNAKDADLILYVTDSSVPLDEDDRKIISFLTGEEDKAGETKAGRERRCLVLYNKSDLKQACDLSELISMLKEKYPVIKISAETGEGIEDLKKEVNELFLSGKIDYDREAPVANLRQKEALENALNSLDHVLDAINNGLPEDFYTIDLRNAYTFLGHVTGEEIGDDVAERIFSEFCMGK